MIFENKNIWTAFKRQVKMTWITGQLGVEVEEAEEGKCGNTWRKGEKAWIVTRAFEIAFSFALNICVSQFSKHLDIKNFLNSYFSFLNGCIEMFHCFTMMSHSIYLLYCVVNATQQSIIWRTITVSCIFHLCSFVDCLFENTLIEIGSNSVRYVL